jgi:hypothetical protein
MTIQLTGYLLIYFNKDYPFVKNVFIFEVTKLWHYLIMLLRGC